jgi:hypothetical protein
MCSLVQGRLRGLLGFSDLGTVRLLQDLRASAEMPRTGRDVRAATDDPIAPQAWANSLDCSAP